MTKRIENFPNGSASPPKSQGYLNTSYFVNKIFLLLHPHFVLDPVEFSSFVGPKGFILLRSKNKHKPIQRCVCICRTKTPIVMYSRK